MRIIKTKDYQDMSRKAANIISAQVTAKPDCVLGLATGSTPIGTYQVLVDRYQKGDLDFSQVKTVNLDEYRGLTHDNDQSYYYFMMHNLFEHVNINLENTHVPDGTEPDADKACSDYEAIVDNYGGMDLQLLGLGHNGHITDSVMSKAKRAFGFLCRPQPKSCKKPCGKSGSVPTIRRTFSCTTTEARRNGPLSCPAIWCCPPMWTS